MKVAALQMTSVADVEANLITARELLERARAQGAQLAALPENFALMGRSESDKLAAAEEPGEGPIQAFLSRCARELSLWLVGGAVPLRAPGSREPGPREPGQREPDRRERVAAASLLFDDRGRCVARYDKIHLFDVDVPGHEERYRESATTVAGAEPVVAPTPLGRLGMAVCYDLRFPELFRILQQQGAEIFTVPSAFTAPTGRAHWELLLRSRAVENLCYMIAPAQSGRHANGRETWGESMIVDPWGQVLDCVREPGPGVAVAEIDRTLLQDLRTRFPALNHRRFHVSF